ncbi:MAG: ammonia-forming cytochrome c nitrite reductase subunit c552 [Pseudomonadota bacterium]
MSFLKKTWVLWTVWGLGSLLAGGALAGILFVGGPRSMMLIGETTSAHKQFELACESCHTTGIVENLTKSPKKLQKAMTKACLTCHKDEKKVSNDSHPTKKFRGAKGAKLRAALNAQQCGTCHMEHTPEITRANAVTLPRDLCSACHQEIGEERATHKGLGFETCASSGCHNFHDNTALYESLLVKNSGGDWLKASPVHAHIAHGRAVPLLFASLSDQDPIKALEDFVADLPESSKEQGAIDKLAKLVDEDKILKAGDAIAPAAYVTADAVGKWSSSAHALNGVNCGACHAPDVAQSTDLSELEQNWIEEPGLTVCADCHREQAKTFTYGKHGMSLHPKISKPRKPPTDNPLLAAVFLFEDQPVPPFKVGDSYLAPKMHKEAHGRELGSCGTCHKPHDVDLKDAAVESCVGCHDDTHTRNYFKSPHYEAWQAELAGNAEPGSGVTCADCHMPKIEGRGGDVFTTHNQNAYFRPNEKMIRPVCMSCHSLDFSIDALADPNLVENNFNGRPAVHIESIDWALSRER